MPKSLVTPRHQLVPVADAVVPAHLRAKFAHLKQGDKLGRAQQKEVHQKIDQIPVATLNDKQKENIIKCANMMNIEVLEPMTFTKANERNANINYKPKSPTAENCALCIAVYEMRRRGLDITAKPYDPKNKIMLELQKDYQKIWLDKNGHAAQVTKHDDDKKDYLKMKDRMLAQCKVVGRYHIGINWIGGGHVITAERLKDGTIIFYDPQNGKFVNIDDYAHAYKIDYLESIRVDNIRINESMLKEIAVPA